MKKIIWFLMDNRMGSVGQAKGIIQALDKERYEIVEKKIDYNRLADLPNFLLGKKPARRHCRYPERTAGTMARPGRIHQPADGSGSPFHQKGLRRNDQTDSADAPGEKRFERLFHWRRFPNMTEAKRLRRTFLHYRMPASRNAGSTGRGRRQMVRDFCFAAAAADGGNCRRRHQKQTLYSRKCPQARQKHSQNQRADRRFNLDYDFAAPAPKPKTSSKKKSRESRLTLIGGARRKTIRLWASGLWPTTLSPPETQFPCPANAADPASLCCCLPAKGG